MSIPNFPEFEYGEDSCVTQMQVPSLDNMILEICVMLEDGASKPSNRQIDVIQSLNKIPSKQLQNEIAAGARQYFREVDSKVELADDGIHIDENQIETHYRFAIITIPKHNECRTDFAVIGMECDWEEEHGMHILLADGHVVYCGSCATLFFGQGWKRVISASESDTRITRLNELLSAIKH
jgi:hypothetical protein